MNDDSPPAPRSAADRMIADWPWGQFGWFLFGLGMFIYSGWHLLAFLFSRGDLFENEALAVGCSCLALAAMGCSIPAIACRILAHRQGRPRPRWLWLRHVNFGLLIGFYLNSALIMFGRPLPVAPTAQPSAAPTEWVEHAFADGAYQISTPSTWRTSQELTLPGTSIHLIDPSNDLALIAAITSKQDLTLTTLEEFSQAAVDAVGAGGTATTLSEPRKSAVGGCLVIDRLMELELEGVNVVMQLRQLDLPDGWVDFRFWTTQSRFGPHRDLFDRIANSFRPAALEAN